MKLYPKEFKLPPHGDSKEEDFDPTIHLEIPPELEEGEEPVSEDELDVAYDSDGNEIKKEPVAWKIEVPTLSSHWLSISPNI